MEELMDNNLADPLRNQVRIEQTYRELAILQHEVQDGLETLLGKDSGEWKQQYHTQLTNLQRVLTDSLAAVCAQIKQIKRIANTAPSGKVYADCRTCEEGLLLLRRVWTYYQSKYDQRDDSPRGRVVAAADEIVWSCYAGVLEQATGARKPPKPVPLPYIEPDYSPKAVPRDEPPPSLSTNPKDVMLWDFLKELPIPVVSLPPVCVEQPWLLISLGHELGHHLQYDLAQNKGLVDSFARLLRQTVTQAAGPNLYEGAPKRWSDWGEEIFADIAAIHCMGPWAGRALTELLLASDRAMLAETSTRYPAPVIRLEILAHVTERLGLSRQDVLGTIDVDELVTRATAAHPDLPAKRIRQDLNIAPAVVDAALKMSLGGAGTFAKLYNWRLEDFANDGIVRTWLKALSGQVPMLRLKTRQTARRIISGAVGTWMERVATIDDAEQRATQRQQLADRLLTALRDNREEGTRAAEAGRVPDVAGLGTRLTQRMLQQAAERQ
jgi:hypothetical protein